MPRGKGERGASVQLPGWWIDLAIPLLENHKDGLQGLGAQIAKCVGRKVAWDHAAVSKFISGRVRTREMAIGASDLLGIPRPSYEPQTIHEALELKQVHEKWSTNRTESNPDKSRKLQAADQVVDVIEEEAEGHTRPLHSDNERPTGRRRARRPARGRTAPS